MNLSFRRLVAPALSAALVSGSLAGAPPAAGAPKARHAEISESGGLGRIELKGNKGAVLQRDEGIVTLLNLKDPARPKILGRYDDGAQRSLDGDLAFSKDGEWLFYARQTEQFSGDGLHVLDVSDPDAPRLSIYQPLGGSYRVATHHDGADEWVFVLDAIHGLVVFKFEPTTGQVIPVAIDALPALKVGGPASAGISVVARDPQLKIPLLYVSTGETGLQVYDISDPVTLEVIGSWSDTGLAEIEVATTKRSRIVYGATEYWFDKSLVPEVVVLDASDLGSITERSRWSAGAVVDPLDHERIQGMALSGGRLLVAHSRLGLIAFDRRGRVSGRVALAAGDHPGPKAQALGGPYAMDVETVKGTAYVSDGSFGRLTLLPLGAI